MSMTLSICSPFSTHDVFQEKNHQGGKTFCDALNTDQVVYTQVCLKKAVAINSANGLTWDNDGFGG
jgi:hypothetical protein